MRFLSLSCIVMIGCSETPFAEAPKKPSPDKQATVQEKPVSETVDNKPTELQRAAQDFADSLDQFRVGIKSLLARGVSSKEDWREAEKELFVRVSKAEERFARALALEKKVDHSLNDASVSVPDREALRRISDSLRESRGEIGQGSEILIGMRKSIAPEKEFIRGYESEDEHFMRDYKAHARKELLRVNNISDDQVDAERLTHWTSELLKQEVRHARKKVQERDAEMAKQEEKIKAALEKVSSLAKAVREWALKNFY